LCGIRIDPPSGVRAEQDGCEAQEALAFGGVRMAAANSGQRKVHDGAGRVADEAQPLERRESPPRVYLALLDIGRGVGSKNPHKGRGRWLRHRAIIERM
jgi:hypothetical protein